MKKIYLFLGVALMSASVGFSQNKKTTIGVQKKSILEVSDNDNPINRKTVSLLRSEEINNEMIDFPVALNAVVQSFDVAVQNAMMPDSSTTIIYAPAMEGDEPTVIDADVHGFGAVYDPTSTFHGTAQFASRDQVNVSRILVNGNYFLRDTNEVNDSLIISVMIGDPEDESGNSPFRIFELTNDQTGFDENVTYVDFIYNGDTANGRHNGLVGPTRTFGYKFTPADSALNSPAIEFLTPGLTIPPNNVMGIFVEYVPKGWEPGDTVDVAADTNGTFNVFRPDFYVSTSDNFGNLRALSDGSLQHNSINLSSFPRYLDVDIEDSRRAGTATSAASLGQISLPLTMYAITWEVSGESTVSISELSNNIDFSVSPNPSNGIFNLSLNAKTSETVDLSIRNMLGQNVFTKTITVAGQVNESISLDNYDKGVYFLTVDNNNEKKTVKLIVN